MDIPKNCSYCLSKYACPWVRGTSGCRLRLEQHEQKEKALKSQESINKVRRESYE
jgi:hypothetical protein